jgi:hypothetical protein
LGETATVASKVRKYVDRCANYKNYRGEVAVSQDS